MKDQTTLNYERRIAEKLAQAQKSQARAKALFREGQKLKRNARTHRLCNLGAMLETYLKQPELFEEDDVKYILDKMFDDERVQLALDRMIERKSGEAAGAADTAATDTISGAE